MHRMHNDPSEADWSFWINWYQGILDGTPQNWPMLHEIATTYTINWDAPAKEVNEKINRVSYQTLQELTQDLQFENERLLSEREANRQKISILSFEKNELSAELKKKSAK